MFLLIPLVGSKTISLNSSFTFHYVSTYTSTIRVHGSISAIYIPLCFYLYYPASTTDDQSYWIYIPLCFYLYRIHSGEMNPISNIYIPLCFYLYDFSAPIILSTMHIYIPLCFYLYWASGQAGYWLVCIYIPLCFYLYRLRLVKQLLRDKFTFHYVSTYTRVETAIEQNNFMIYIPLCFYLYLSLVTLIAAVQDNLHSTMFLLIRMTVYLGVRSIFYLHSTMFLLIQPLNWWEQRSCIHLHSTMFLLIRTTNLHWKSPTL